MVIQLALFPVTGDVVQTGGAKLALCRQGTIGVETPLGAAFAQQFGEFLVRRRGLV
jgi:hypothetical protein